MRSTTRWFLFAWCGALLSLAHTARADEPQADAPPPVICPICHRANLPETPYPEKAGRLLARGATNTAFGWTELLLQPAQEAKSGGNLAVGIGRGVSSAVSRTGRGLGELLTFWVPKDPKRLSEPLATDCPICMGKR